MAQDIQPKLTKIVPWEEIEHFYRDLIDHHWEISPLLHLVQFIRTNDLDKRIFAYTSMDRLIVTIYNPAEWQREALHIEFNQHTRKWHFEYFPKPYEAMEMERYYAEDLGIEKFCKYIDWLKW